MILSTTTLIEGRPVRDYLGVVTGEVIVGAHIFKDLFAGVRNIVGIDLVAGQKQGANTTTTRRPAGP